MSKALIFDVKRFAVHDGDGIRTTVFFKGCPLKCVWCHNPEGISPKAELGFYSHKCISCGECVKSCPQNAHYMQTNIHIFNKSSCIACGNCEADCLGDALKLHGKIVKINDLMPILLEDKDFFEASGGGVTLSGGECLLQADFCRELLAELKKNKIHTAVDTCGFVPKASIDKVLSFTDIFLYDLKAYDEGVHIQCTGKSNKIILENLKYIDSLGKATEIRIPFVPDYNDRQIEQLAQFISTLNHITRVKILPYHNYASSKYTSLEMENTLPQRLPKDNEIHAAVEIMRAHGISCV